MVLNGLRLSVSDRHGMVAIEVGVEEGLREEDGLCWERKEGPVGILFHRMFILLLEQPNNCILA